MIATTITKGSKLQDLKDKVKFGGLLTAVKQSIVGYEDVIETPNM